MLQHEVQKIILLNLDFKTVFLLRGYRIECVWYILCHHGSILKAPAIPLAIIHYKWAIKPKWPFLGSLGMLLELTIWMPLRAGIRYYILSPMVMQGNKPLGVEGGGFALSYRELRFKPCSYQKFYDNIQSLDICFSMNPSFKKSK